MMSQVSRELILSKSLGIVFIILAILFICSVVHGIKHGLIEEPINQIYVVTFIAIVFFIMGLFALNL